MKKYLIIFVCVLLCGCVSTKKVRNQSLEVAKFDTAKFNGNYANKADKSYKSFTRFSSSNSSLIVQLLNEDYPIKNNPTTDSIAININFNGKRTVIITAIEKGQILHKRKLKGKIKGNYFSVRRELVLIPIPMFFYVYNERKILLGNDKNGNLILKLRHSHFGWVFIILSSGDNYGLQSQYKKIK